MRAWHRWFGLLVGPWLLLLALTGSAITFYDDLDAWLNPDWRGVPIAEVVGPPAVDAAMAAAGAALPGFAPRFVNLPNRPGETIATLGSYAPTPGEHVEIEAFSHPGSGRLLGWRETERLGLGPRHLMNTVYALHIDLAMGPLAAWLIGLVALLWIIDHIPAAMLAVPRIRHAFAAFAIAKGGGLRRLYDLHRAPGLWFFPMTLMLAVTGVGLAWPEESRDAVRLASPVSDRLHYEMPDAATDAGPAIGIDRALVLFEARVGADVDSVLPLPGKGLYAIRSFDQRDPDDLGRLWTYLDMATGRVVASRHDNGASVGDTVFAWLYPLHSGRAFGNVGQALVLVAGLVTAALAVTGYVLWAKRRRQRVRRTGLPAGDGLRLG